MTPNSFQFDTPIALSAFAVFIFLVLFDILGRQRKFTRKLPEELNKKMRLSILFFRLFIAFAIIALAGPRWGTGYSTSGYRRGLDVVFAIDVSRSMDIRDALSGGETQSRLERGLSISRESALYVSGARFAAAIGRGRGYLAIPLTWDNEAALSFLESLDGSSITGRSTNLESLVDAAADAFQSSSVAQKAIVLVSDGESLGGVLRNAVIRCVREGVMINAVAVGSDTGRLVPFGADDPQAPPVVSRREAAVMRTAAERTGGVYIDGSREDAASVLAAHLHSLAQETGTPDSRKEPKERRTLFIILALIAYGASKFAHFNWHLPRRLPLVSLIVILLSFNIFTSCSKGKILLLEANYLHSHGRYDEALIPYQKALEYADSAPYAEYGLGVTFHSLENGLSALKGYENSKKKLEGFPSGEHLELRFRNHYNSGIVFFEEGDFHAAAEAFKDALRTDPKRIEAKRNLELSLMSINKKADDNSGEKNHENETREILFDFLKEKEQQIWKSREWAPEEKPTGPDY